MTTDCGTVRESLRGYVENSLEEREMERVGRHLAVCPSCRSEIEAERRLCRDLSTLPKQSCPETVADSIMRSLENSGGVVKIRVWRKIRIRQWGLKPAFAAVLAVFLAVGFREWTRRPRQSETVYSEADLKLAGAALDWSLAFAAGTIRQAEKQALETVFTVPSTGLRKTPVKSGGSKR